MLFIILYNLMVVLLIVLLIFATINRFKKKKYIISAVMIIINLYVFIIPNINYFRSPFSEPFEVFVLDNNKPVDGFIIITARGLKFTSFFAHLPSVNWKTVEISNTDSSGKVVFGKYIKFMNINFGLIGKWGTNDDVLLIALKDDYYFSLKIFEPKRINIIKTTKHFNKVLSYDVEKFEYFLSKKLGGNTSDLMKTYYNNNLKFGEKHE